MNQREHLAALARETLAILEAGEYEINGTPIAIWDWLETARAGTRLYTPEDLDGCVPGPGTGEHSTRFRVEDATTLAAARERAEAQDTEPLCLNFASARKPGGGFRSGARAQEESLTRASGLYSCLCEAQGYYDANRRCDSALYTDHMIYSPGVPVFRDEAGNLRRHPWRASMVTAPAVNVSALRKNEPERLAEVEPVMRQRMAYLLALALDRGHGKLVLGAWGCGVFGQDPADVAAWFRELLYEDERFRGVFQEVTFAVPAAAGQRALAAFQSEFS